MVDISNSIKKSYLCLEIGIYKNNYTHDLENLFLSLA